MRLHLSDEGEAMAEGESGKEKEIEVTVREILEGSDMNDMTEYKVRKEASSRLGIDLSLPNYKSLVRSVVQSFLEQQTVPKDEAVDEGSDQVAGGDGGGGDDDEDEDEDHVICKLTKRRKVTMQEFGGKKLVSIREYYSKGGKDLPTSKGISLTEEQWSVLSKNLPAIQNAIKKMESHST
ncbi:hypothetical protein MLD38_013909 [Melastoma candidum]|uniref:Uncharacterized protein n=1 Tax=Melastoma candidum TaxID=119954 RepID=A0ACB9RJJ6_9MYRT|nr:hypothetical protein MLD38_013909 [Melastoma candidum]